MTAPAPETVTEDTADDTAADVVTNDELDAKRDEVAKLREELAEAEAERAAREAERANSVTARQLDNEADRLRALIAAARGESPLTVAYPVETTVGAGGIQTVAEPAPEKASTPPAAAGTAPTAEPAQPSESPEQPGQTAPAETTGEGA